MIISLFNYNDEEVSLWKPKNIKKIRRSLKMPKIFFITSQQKLKALVIKIMKIRERFMIANRRV